MLHWKPPTVCCEPVHAVSACYWCSVASSSARADTYPSQPVRIIVPYGPGGIADVTMRMVAQDLSQHLGQQFFIENRPGAGGVVGMQAAQEAPADGYTLVMIGGGLTIAKALFKSLPYDIETDFTPISTTASYGLVIATKAGSPYKTIKDVIAAAKARPGTLNFGTINAGSSQNLSAELFRTMVRHRRHDHSVQDDAGPRQCRLARRCRRRFRIFRRIPVAHHQWPDDCARHHRARTRRQFAECADGDRERRCRLRGDKLERARRRAAARPPPSSPSSIAPSAKR